MPECGSLFIPRGLVGWVWLMLKYPERPTEVYEVGCLDSKAQHARNGGSVCAGMDMALDFPNSVQSSSFRNGFDFVGSVAEGGLMSWLLCIASNSATTTAERQTRTDSYAVNDPSRQNRDLSFRERLQACHAAAQRQLADRLLL
jgi:hypothetical protein